MWKQPKCLSIDEWKNKMWYTYTLECYSAIKQNKMLVHATTCMNLQNIILSEISQTQQENIV